MPASGWCWRAAGAGARLDAGERLVLASGWRWRAAGAGERQLVMGEPQLMVRERQLMMSERQLVVSERQLVKSARLLSSQEGVAVIERAPCSGPMRLLAAPSMHFPTGRKTQT